MSVNIVVLDVLKNAGEPLKAGEIAEKASLDVDKAIKALKNEGIIISPKRCYYTVQQKISRVYYKWLIGSSNINYYN